MKGIGMNWGIADSEGATTAKRRNDEVLNAGDVTKFSADGQLSELVGNSHD